MLPGVATDQGAATDLGAGPDLGGAGARRGVWSTWVAEACRSVEAAGQWRRPRTFDARGAIGALEGGSLPFDTSGPRLPLGTDEVVSFASNDYLGLSHRPSVVEAAHAALDRWGAGSGASRLVTGSRPVHVELEDALAAYRQAERAVLFPTGFAANLSVLSVFGAAGAHIFSDALNHASIVDGCRMARAPVTVYPHSDLDRLAALVEAAEGRPVVVTDTVFSMDGDAADLPGLLEIAVRYGALLVLDEAHAVLGPALPSPLPHGADVLRVGTLSKTLGSLGGFVAGPARFVELLVNRARPYIFTTAPSPADAAAALAALGVVQSAEGDRLRARLADHTRRVLRAGGRQGTEPVAPIVPVVLGAEERAVAASAELLERGLWVPAIRPPTVPPGTSRLRVTLSAAHSDEQVDRLVEALDRLVGGLGGQGR